jgi:hemerythrin-like metal-binding protein
MDPRIDADHLTLFKLLDRMGTHRRASDIDELNPLLDQLLEHTFDHFTREEQMMQSWGYTGAAGHILEHEAMRKAFIESLRRVVKGDQAVPAFIQHARESFTYHFETADMVFIHWLQMNRPTGTG